MSLCAFTGGMDATCDDLKKIGGLNRRVWLANLDNGGKLSYLTDVDGYVTAITFPTYGGLYTFESKDLAHSAGSQLVVSDGGKYFQHDATIKLFSGTPADDIVIEELSVANIVLITETNDKKFFIYGAENGLDMTVFTQNSGQTADSDTTDNLEFQGRELNKPLRFLDTDYATSLALLESYEIVAP